MRKVIAFVLLCGVGSVYANTIQLSSFDQLVDSLRQGDDVKAVISLDDCQKVGQSTKSNSLSGAFVRVNFNVFNYYKIKDEGKNNFAVATSTAMLIEHSALGPVQTYSRIRIWDDNSISMHVSYYDPRNYDLKLSSDYLCHLGKDDQSVRLFASKI